METHVFTVAIKRHRDDEQYRVLQVALLLRPTQGVLIPGGEGLRKLRWGVHGRGKRGGLRVIHSDAIDESVCCMLYACATRDVGDLTPVQLRALAQLVREEFP